MTCQPTDSAGVRLAAAHDAYVREVSRTYDEVLAEVSGRIEATTSIGKADIGALLFWKRLRADTKWVRDLMLLPDAHVRTVTQAAVASVRDPALTTPAAAAAGRSALSPLPGFGVGDALASALLVAAAPARMAVYDRRAQVGLGRLGMTLSSSSGRYGRYMTLVEELRVRVQDECDRQLSARDVDLALYWLGGR